MPDIVKLDLAVARAPKRVRGRMPLNAPITALGLSKDGASQLTDAAAKLRKSDLVLLGQDRDAAKQLGLTAKDVNSIRNAFSKPIDIGLGRAGGAALDISCCCCTPCCCAAAAIETPQPIA